MLHQAAMGVVIARQRVRESVPLDATMADGSPSFGALLFGHGLGPASAMRPRWPWRRGPKRGIAQGVIDGWTKHPTIGPALGNVVGLFLGSVLVRHVDGAQWHVWPNGHPVVRLRNGREYDVVALADQRVQIGEPHLPSILAEARNRSM